MKEKRKIWGSVANFFDDIKDKEIRNEIVVEKSIYYDGRQYSFKIPKEVMETVGYKKGDKIHIIVTDIRSGNPKIELRFKRYEGIQNKSST